MNDISKKYKIMERKFGEDEGLNVTLMEEKIGFYYNWLGNLVTCMGSNSDYRAWDARVVTNGDTE